MSKTIRKRSDKGKEPQEHIDTVLDISPSTDISKHVSIDIITEDPGFSTTWSKPETKSEYIAPEVNERPPERARIPKEVQDKTKAQLAQDNSPEQDEDYDGEEGEYVYINPTVAEYKLKRLLKIFPEFEGEFLDIGDPKDPATIGMRLQMIEECIEGRHNIDAITMGAKVCLKFIEVAVSTKTRFNIKGMSEKTVAMPEWERSMTALSLEWKPYLDEQTGGMVSSPYVGLAMALMCGAQRAYDENTKNEVKSTNSQIVYDS